MPYPYLHLLLHFGVVVGVVLGGRSTTTTTSINHHQQPQQQISSSDSDFADEPKEWVEDSLVHPHPLSSPSAKLNRPQPRYPYPVSPEDVPSHYYHYADVDILNPDRIRYHHRPYTLKTYSRPSPQNYIRPQPQSHLTWSSELPQSEDYVIRPNNNNNGHRHYYYQLYNTVSGSGGGVGGHGHGWVKRPDEPTTSNLKPGGSFGQGGSSGTRNGGGINNNIIRNQQQPRGTQVNYAAVSLLGLLALMGTIQHVMTDLDASLASSLAQSNTDFETGNSISGNRPHPIRPLRPTGRPSLVTVITMRPSASGGGGGGKPTTTTQRSRLISSTARNKPFRHKMHTI